MNAIDITTATTAELVAFWNAHAEKPVKKFADRKTAERRVAALIETLTPKVSKKTAKKEAAAALVAERLSKGLCVHCGADSSSQTGNGPQGTFKGDNELFCHECCGAYDATTGAKRKPFGESASADRSAAIAASWKNPETAAMRAARLHVRVNGVWFRSVPQAFRELRLPMSKHIAFRGQLREAGQLTFTHKGHDFVFELALKESEE